jgi:hypothetical protein
MAFLHLINPLFFSLFLLFKVDTVQPKQRLKKMVFVKDKKDTGGSCYKSEKIRM